MVTMAVTKIPGQRGGGGGAGSRILVDAAVGKCVARVEVL